MAKGIGISNMTVTVKHPRRTVDVTKDLRDMCSHLSTDISVIMNTVTVIKYVALESPIVRVTTTTSGLSIPALSFRNMAATRNGWETSPVHKSEKSSSKSLPK